MNFRFVLRLSGGVLAVSLLAACSPMGVKPLRHYQPDAFGASMYTRHYLSTPAEACEAARRALLSQGYVVTEAKANLVSARKLFQPDIQHHVQMEFQVTCAADGPKESIAFASATQDQYVTKSASNSASLGVGLLGSVSVPLEGGLDSMVKIASKTVTDGEVYDRLFALMGGYLVSVEREAGKNATIESITPKPKAAPAAANTPAPAPAPLPAPSAAAPATAPAAASLAPGEQGGATSGSTVAPAASAPAPASVNKDAASAATPADPLAVPDKAVPPAAPAASVPASPVAPATDPSKAPAAAPVPATDPVSSPTGSAAPADAGTVAVQTTPDVYAAPGAAPGAAAAPSTAVQTTPESTAPGTAATH